MKKKFNLSNSQKAIIKSEIISGLKNLYNISFTYLIEGELNIKLLEIAFNQIIQSHKMLRMRLCSYKIDTNYYIENSKVYSIKYIDLLDLNITKNDKDMVFNFLDKEFIDLKSEIPIKCIIIKDKDDLSYLRFFFHHITVDNYSIEIFLSELSKLYNKLISSKGKESIKILDSYEKLNDDEYESNIKIFRKENLNYWLKYIKNSDFRALPKTINYSGKTNNIFYADKVSFEIGDEQLKFINKKVMEIDSTLFNYLITCIYCLVNFTSDLDEPIIGYSSINRYDQKTKDNISSLVNILPFKLKINNKRKIYQLLDESKIHLINAVDKIDFDFDELIEKSKIKRDTIEHPIYGVVFAFLGNLYNFQLDKSKLTHLAEKANYTKFPITIYCENKKNKLYFTILYSKAKFKHEQIYYFSKSLQHIIKTTILNPKEKVNNLTLIDYNTNCSIIYNKKTEINDNDHLVHELKSKLDKKPFLDSGIVYNSNYYNYHTLIKDVNSVTALLKKYISFNDKVLISASPSYNYIVTVLSIISCGAIFSPVNIKSNSEYRVNKIIDQLKPNLCITDNVTNDKVKKMVINTIDINTLIYNSNSISTNKKELDILKNPEIAIIFTSGSTGNPKGVKISHNSVLNRVKWNIKNYPSNSIDRFIFLADTSFVDSINEIFIPLLHLANLYIPDNSNLKLQPDKLITFIKKNLITRISFIPSLLSILINNFNKDLSKLTSLKHIEVSGEKFHFDQILKTLHIFSFSKLINRYGSTEATSILYNELYLEDNSFKTISNLVSDTAIGVFNKNFQLLPKEFVGEIVIFGKSLSNGYLDKTENKFFDHHSIEVLKKYKKYYKTGDIGYISNENCVEILNRKDNQIKINGFRVETREIEMLINYLDYIKENVVISKTDLYNQNFLECFISLVDSSKIDHIKVIDKIKDYVEKNLPPYMIPKKFTILDDLPRNSSGKINIESLKHTNQNINYSKKTFTLPRNFKEFEIYKIWEKILNFSDFGINDDFFKIGGNSILAIKTIAKIQEKLKTKLPFQILYKNRTIASLAKNVNYNLDKIQHNIFFEINQNNNDQLILVHPAPGFSFPYEILSKYIKHFKILGINDPSLFDQNITFTSIESKAEYYAKKIISKGLRKNYIIGGWSFGGAMALEISRILIIKGIKPSAVLLFDSSLRPKKHYYDWSEDEIRQDIERIGLSYSSEEAKKIINVMKQNGKLLKYYNPTPYKGRVILFKAQDDEFKSEFRKKDFFQGWLNCLKNELEIVSVEGSHIGLFDKENAENLAEKILNIINQPSLRDIINNYNINTFEKYLYYAKQINDIFIINRINQILYDKKIK